MPLRSGGGAGSDPLLSVLGEGEGGSATGGAAVSSLRLSCAVRLHEASWSSSHSWTSCFRVAMWSLMTFFVSSPSWRFTSFSLKFWYLSYFFSLQGGLDRREEGVSKACRCGMSQPRDTDGCHQG